MTDPSAKSEQENLKISYSVSSGTETNIRRTWPGQVPVNGDSVYLGTHSFAEDEPIFGGMPVEIAVLADGNGAEPSTASSTLTEAISTRLNALLENSAVISARMEEAKLQYVKNRATVVGDLTDYMVIRNEALSLSEGNLLTIFLNYVVLPDIQDAATVAASSIYDLDIKSASTLAGAVVIGEYALVFGLADSDVFLEENGSLTQLLLHHNVYTMIALEGGIEPNEVMANERAFRLSNPTSNQLTLTAAIGTHRSIPKLSSRIVKIGAGDRLLLNSDGLVDGITTEEIENIVHGGFGNSIGSLVSLARNRGGKDDATGILIERKS